MQVEAEPYPREYSSHHRVHPGIKIFGCFFKKLWAHSSVAATHTPIVFIGTGEHVFDLERFSPKPFISKLLGMGDMEGLVEHVQSLQLNQKDTMKHLAEGVFTIRDLRDQLSNVMKMGPLSKMAGMIPGLNQMMSAGATGAGNGMDDEEGNQKLKRMIFICDSMTDYELDSDGSLFRDRPTRLTRVARGSGTSVREIEDLLAQQRMMASMAKKMKGNMANLQRAQNVMGGGGGAASGAAAAPNRPQHMAAMQRRLQSMGAGAGARPAAGLPGLGAGMDLGAMMKALGGDGGPNGIGASMPGMPAGMDMASIMKQMSGFMGGGGGGGGDADTNGRGGRARRIKR